MERLAVLDPDHEESSMLETTEMETWVRGESVSACTKS